MTSPYPHVSEKVWNLLLSYAKSGDALCHGCKNIIKENQYVFEYKGNVYHDVCSIGLEGRMKL